MSCIFCRIVAREAEASVLYEDELVMAFMTIRPVNEGEFLLIPKAHVDHFCDLSDEVSCRIICEAQRLSRNLRERLKPERVGLVVHGYGVAHAHLAVVPLHDPDDITAGKLARVEGGEIKFGVGHIPETPRAELDRLARLLA